MSEPALSLAFFDAKQGLYGTARSGATLLFEGSAANALPDGPEFETFDGGWRASLPGALELEMTPVAGPARLGPVTAHVCQARGRVGDRNVDCLATVGETRTPPQWDDLHSLRSISALFSTDDAFLALGRRPRGAPGHDEEALVGWLLEAGAPLDLEDTRISTTYDGDGRQRSAGLELWTPGEEFPRRGSGTVVAGSSLELEGLDVHAAIFRWRMEDREGLGAYELWLRREPEAA